MEEWGKKPRWTEHVLFVGDNIEFVLGFFPPVLISSLAFMEPVGLKQNGEGASGLHLKPLCWAIKKKMRQTSSSWEEFAAKQQSFSALVNINGALITNLADINLAKWLTETAVTQG